MTKNINLFFKKTLNKILKKYNSKQAILIYETADKNIKGTFFDLDTKPFNFNVVIGKNGFNKTKEGDNKTPIGIYHITFGFGKEKIKNKNFSWLVVDQNDYWIDDINSKNYNKHIQSTSKPKESCEQLNNILYKYALVYDFNIEGKPPLGSALFLHIWRNKNSTTSGCTAMSEKNIKKIINNLDHNKNPILIQGDLNFYNLLMEKEWH